MFCGLGLGRCCCCGKYKPTPQLCCGDADEFEPTTNGYTDVNVLVLLIISIVVCVILAVGAGFGIAGSVEMTNSLNKAANFTNQTAFKFVDILQSVIDVFQDVSENGGNFSDIVSKDTLDAAEKTGYRITNVTDDIAEYIDEFDVPRQIVMYISLILPLVLMLLVVLSRFVYPVWWMTWGMSFCGFIITFIALVMFGILYPVAGGISDVCVFLDESLDSKSGNDFIKSFFECSEGSVLGSFSEKAEKIMNKAAGLSCTLVNSLRALDMKVPVSTPGGVIDLDDSSNYGNVIAFPTEINDLECNITTFETITEKARILNRKIGCFYAESATPQHFETTQCTENVHSLYNNASLCPEVEGKIGRQFYCYANLDDAKTELAVCAEKCYDWDLKQDAARIVKYVDVFSRTFNIYNSKIKPYINCESLVEIVNRAKDFACVDVVNSVTPMYVGEIMAAVGSFVGTFVALLSTKRFRKKYRRKYAIIEAGGHEIEL